MGLGQVTGRVADMVRDMLPFTRQRFTVEERDLAAYIRGNTALMECLNNVIKLRIQGRASSQVPSDPIKCLVSMEKDRECRLILNRLQAIYESPVTEQQEQGEQPAT